MSKCIFCDIIAGKSHSYNILEDEEHLAFLDIFPPTFNEKITSPNVVVIIKRHYKSNAFDDLPEEEYSKILLFTRKVAKQIQKNLKPLKVCMVIEGFEIEHFHIKLYTIFRKYYPGYLSTMKGPNNKATLASGKALENVMKKMNLPALKGEVSKVAQTK